MRKLYLNEVVSRINQIKWNEVRTKENEENSKLGIEYLRRLAIFFREESVRPIHPMIANIAKILGDVEEGIKISDFCSKEASDFLTKEAYFGKVFEYYIQLARYVDINPTYSKYLSVYEPLIRIAERGGFFVLKPHELDIINVSYIPLGNWYERYVIKEPIDISNL
ncbi:hypothetical protein [Brevibacillus brevis]|uniref:hypothetical protein n=1 Tax=Brevibacillus brevis TaxID=1393 RepID=UPI003B002516